MVPIEVSYLFAESRLTVDERAAAIADLTTADPCVGTSADQSVPTGVKS